MISELLWVQPILFLKEGHDRLRAYDQDPGWAGMLATDRTQPEGSSSSTGASSSSQPSSSASQRPRRPTVYQLLCEQVW